MSRANRLRKALHVISLLAAITGAASAQSQEKRRTDWLDPDLAGFILKNANQLRYEIKHAEGPRLDSLLSQLKLIDRKIEINCIQEIEQAERNAYGLYISLTDAEGKCPE